jgi:hypothetical protein
VALILLTAARARRAAAQYFGPAIDLKCTDTATHEFRNREDPRRVLRVWQESLGSITLQEFHQYSDKVEEVYKADHELPAIGPINFNKTV